MKQILFILISLLLPCCTSMAQKQDGGNSAASGRKILVAYFSCTGNTEKVADAIAQAVDGRLYRITPAQAYTQEDLNWNNEASRSSMEMKDEASRPPLKGEQLDMKDYDVVFLGYPIWWNICPRPVNTFIEKYDLTGKTVIPFATSGGSAISHSVERLKALYPKTRWQEGWLFNHGTDEAKEWAKTQIHQ